MKYSPVLLIFVVALTLRASFAIHARGIPAFDAAGYDSRAISFLQAKGWLEPTAFKEPFYSFFLAFIYFVFGHSYMIVRIIQAILGALVCVFVFFLGKGLFNEKVGTLSGFICSINPSFIKSTELLLTESFYTFILALSVLYSLQVIRLAGRKNSIILGLLLGIGSMTRSVMLPYAVLTCVALFFILKRKNYFQKALISVSVIFLSLLTIILPWTLRNWLVFHEFIPISTNVGINIYSSYFPPQGKLFGFTASDKNTEYAKSLGSEPAESKFLLHTTIKKIRELGCAKVLNLCFLKFAYFWCPFDWEIIGGGSYNLLFAFILPFFVAAFIFLLKSIGELTFLYLPIVYSLAASLVTYGSPRFRLPVEPYIILFASSGMYSFWMRTKNKKWVYNTLFLWFLANFIVFINCTYAKSVIKRWISF